MEILGIGPLELLFILLIALIAVGPRDLGRAARSLGRLLNQLYRSEAWRNLSEASRNLRTLPNRLAREAALDELDQARQDIQREVSEFASDVSDAADLQKGSVPSPAQAADDPPGPAEPAGASDEAADAAAESGADMREDGGAPDVESGDAGPGAESKAQPSDQAHHPTADKASSAPEDPSD